MVLREGIILSKKHQRSFEVFPYFFGHALNYFYFLTEDCGFLKPTLDTWRNEGVVKFESKDIKVFVEYESPGWVGVCFQKTDVPGRLYERRLFEVLDIVFDGNLLKPSKDQYSREPEKQMQEIEQDIERTTRYLSLILSEHRERIFSYLRNTSSLVQIKIDR